MISAVHRANKSYKLAAMGGFYHTPQGKKQAFLVHSRPKRVADTD
jgi:hypothetical protein